MRVFVTGGAGYVGSAVLDSLVRGGHRVDALLRNTEGPAKVQARGAHPVIGELLQPASWRDAAAAAEGSIHAAAQPGARARAADEAAVDVLTMLPPKNNRFLIYTSGVWVLGPATTPVDDSAPVNPMEIVSWRPAHEKRVLDTAAACAPAWCVPASFMAARAASSATCSRTQPPASSGSSAAVKPTGRSSTTGTWESFTHAS